MKLACALAAASSLAFCRSRPNPQRPRSAFRSLNAASSSEVPPPAEYVAAGTDVWMLVSEAGAGAGLGAGEGAGAGDGLGAGVCATGAAAVPPPPPPPHAATIATA